MQNRVSLSLQLFIVFAVAAACAERQSPFEPIPLRPLTNVMLPPSVSEQVLPVPDFLNPAITLPLPTYAEALIAEFRLNGIISVESLHATKNGKDVDGSGYYRSDGWEACYVNVVFRYTQGIWGPGPCSTTPPQSLRVDTVLVKGEGNVTRGPAVPQWSWECPEAPACWGYTGEQTFSVTPLSAAIKLLTPGIAEVAAGTIEVAPATWITFTASSNPTNIKSITVPIRVISWRWTATSGGAGQTTTCASSHTGLQCPTRVTEPGSMVLTGVVNGVEQIATVIVSVPKVKVAPQMTTMRPSTLTPLVRDTSIQAITVSMEGIAGPLPNKTVGLTVTAVEGTAGHSHTGSKPKGNFLPTGATVINVNTGSTGVVTVKYQAPDPSGPVKVKGASSVALPDSVEIQVAYTDLVELTPGATYLLTGEKPAHPQNHYGTEAHIANLKKLADFFFAKFGDRPTFNDTSLELGGLYDIGSPWTYPHRAHRQGRHTDLRTTEPQRTETQRIALWIAWERFGGTVRDETKNPDGSPNTINPHYHLIY